jgi:hypothetical protein
MTRVPTLSGSIDTLRLLVVFDSGVIQAGSPPPASSKLGASFYLSLSFGSGIRSGFFFHIFSSIVHEKPLDSTKKHVFKKKKVLSGLLADGAYIRPARPTRPTRPKNPRPVLPEYPTDMMNLLFTAD